MLQQTRWRCGGRDYLLPDDEQKHETARGSCRMSDLRIDKSPDCLVDLLLQDDGLASRLKGVSMLLEASGVSHRRSVGREAVINIAESRPIRVVHLSWARQRCLQEL